MVKTRTVAPLRPTSTKVPATKIVEKGRRRCFEIKSLELAVEDVTSERQSCACKQTARQARRKRIQMQKAIDEELECITDLKLYAAYLAVESGNSLGLKHPWIKKLIDVSNRKLHPHELLKTYRENPGSLKIADGEKPNHYWMPPEAEGTAALQSMSRCAAMRALVGNQNWKESPKLQALQAAQKESKSKRARMPFRKLRDEDDLEDFLGYICEVESEIWNS